MDYKALDGNGKISAHIFTADIDKITKDKIVLAIDEPFIKVHK
ncbi:MAG: hypothetical protein E6357_29585 [Clostridiales bacterium]|nr:hypothetical protein [Clostridiales bacterium]